MMQSHTVLPRSQQAVCLRLRDELRDLRIEGISVGSQPKRFFPEHLIRRLFASEVVRTLIQCCCEKCYRHRCLQKVTDPLTYIPRILASSSTNCYDDAGYVVVLALLLHIGCPALVYAFIDKRFGDQRLRTQTSMLTAEYLQNKIWCNLASDEVKRYSDDLNRKKYKFAVPHIQGDHYEEFESLVILPFVNETRLGRLTENGEIVNEGSFGDVYSFEIPEQYCHFPELHGSCAFARKELRRDTFPNRFCVERDNLIKVKKLEDRHLIKLVKSYRHGDTYCFIFPRAKTNLNLLLRQPSLQGFSDFKGLMLWHPLWDQMLGIARGLHKVLYYEGFDMDTSYGYHFDLKPANILVDYCNDLIITDFGQAHFKTANGTSSRVRGMGGNEAYAPPEIDEVEVINNRKYDIWSLGGILLEVVTFVVKLQTGVREFDEIRIGRSDPFTNTFHIDDRFFQRSNESGSYELKPGIKQWIQRLPEFVQEEGSKIFIQKILEVISEMLDVDIDTRLSSKDVCVRLDDILRGRNASDTESESAALPLPEFSEDKLYIGKELVNSIGPIQFNLDGNWNTARLYFVQESASLSVQYLEGRRWVLRSLGCWNQYKLIPQYVMHDQRCQSLWDATIVLTQKDLTTETPRKQVKFTVPETSMLQDILLAQITHKQIKLASVTIELRRARSWTNLIRRSTVGDEHSDLTDISIPNATAVQCWTASPRDDMIGPGSSDRRQLPRSLRPGPNVFRIVIFCPKTILILRVGKNTSIEVRSGQDVMSESVVIVPTNKTVDPSFSVSILKSTDSEPPPGFALGRDYFERQEVDAMVECTSLMLKFRDVDDAESFRRSYRRLKKRWSEQMKQFISLEAKLSTELGYYQSR